MTGRTFTGEARKLVPGDYVRLAKRSSTAEETVEGVVKEVRRTKYLSTINGQVIRVAAVIVVLQDSTEWVMDQSTKIELIL